MIFAASYPEKMDGNKLAQWLKVFRRILSTQLLFPDYFLSAPPLFNDQEAGHFSRPSSEVLELSNHAKLYLNHFGGFFVLF